MTTTHTSLRSVTLQTVANYRHAAERTLRAYRSGGQRLIAVVRDGVDQAAQRGAEPYVPGLAAALRRAGDNLGNLAHQGLVVVSARTSRAISVGADGVTSQVRRVADLADGVDNRVVATGLQAAVRVSLPGARVALALSERFASGADMLADVAAGAPARQAAQSAQATNAAGKRVRKAEAKAAATDVVAAVQAKARTAVRRSKAQASAAAAAAAAVAKPTKAVAGPVKAASKPVKAAAKPTKTAAEPLKAVKAQARKVAAKPQVKQAVAAVTRTVQRSRAKAGAVVQASQDAAATVAAA